MYAINQSGFKGKKIVLFLLLLGQNAIAQEADSEQKAEDAIDDSTPAEVGEEAPKAGPAPAIYIAAKAGRLKQVRALIAEGADINASNRTGRTVLMSAVYYGNRGIVKELLIEGADVNAADAQGRTALMMAVVNNDTEIVDLLISAGADVSLQDKNKKTAASLAENIKNKKLAKLLEQ